MSKSQTHGLWRRFTKKINWHNEVHTYWCQFWCHIWWWPKTVKMCIESAFEQFGDLHIWHQYWHQYVWTSLCEFIFFVNLLHSPGVWLFDIWHLFDNLTSFWQLEGRYPQANVGTSLAKVGSPLQRKVAPLPE